MADWMSLLPFLGIVFTAALSGALFMPGPWYETLDKPSWTPPNWLFAPAWLVLYVMIAIAGWLVWRDAGYGPALAWWGANIVFNAAWSWLMFGRKRIDLALVDAIAMLVTIIGFIATALPVNETAALLFLPYLAWVSFAAALNAAILKRNPRAA
ncbi:MAG: TspO/MBR family protein [Hyphomicrobiaceae bacterium]|nr:TspO/MBR family protein [Hyphomicrobiaceae bacterium]